MSPTVPKVNPVWGDRDKILQANLGRPQSNWEKQYRGLNMYQYYFFFWGGVPIIIIVRIMGPKTLF